MCKTTLLILLQWPYCFRPTLSTCWEQTVASSKVPSFEQDLTWSTVTPANRPRAETASEPAICLATDIVWLCLMLLIYICKAPLLPFVWTAYDPKVHKNPTICLSSRTWILKPEILKNPHFVEICCVFLVKNSGTLATLFQWSCVKSRPNPSFGLTPGYLFDTPSPGPFQPCSSAALL